MPWKGVTVSEQRLRFLEDYKLNYYSVTDLASRFSVSRKTAYTHPGHQGNRRSSKIDLRIFEWIHRFEEYGQQGFHESKIVEDRPSDLRQSRRPHSCPRQTDAAIVEELVKLRKAHPHWGPRKLLDLMHRRNPRRKFPAVSTAALILARQGLVRPRRRH